MPRQPKFSAEEIVDAAFELVRNGGWAELTAAAVGKKLGSSTMPVFYHFKNIGEIEEAVIEQAWDLLLQYEKEEVTGDKWIDHAIGYSRFSYEEKYLFHCIDDPRHPEKSSQMRMMHWEFLSGELKDYEAFKTLGRDAEKKVRFARAMISHGLGNWINTGWSKMIPGEDEMVQFIKKASASLLKGASAFEGEPEE